jgi:hypothetical protein
MLFIIIIFGFLIAAPLYSIALNVLGFLDIFVK